MRGLYRSVFSEDVWRLLAGGFFLLLTGCSLIPAKQFTLETELPANFGFKAKAYYEPAPGQTCELPPRRPGHIPGIKYFESEIQVEAHTSVLKVPLTDWEGWCPLVLRSFSYEIDARFGPYRGDIGGDFAGLSFREKLSQERSAFPASGVQIFQGECRWAFRTMGPYRRIVKILKCRAIDEGGKLQSTARAESFNGIN